MSGDIDLLLQWKATLPDGECLGCQNGPVFRNWTAGTDVCEWHENVKLPGEQNGAVRGVTRCWHHNQAVTKL
jgi:hypothetical protein